MQTIIEYTNTKVPENRFPSQIVSPPQSSSCCFSAMEEVGPLGWMGAGLFNTSDAGTVDSRFGRSCGTSPIPLWAPSCGRS